jgi:hypothetical protein
MNAKSLKRALGLAAAAASTSGTMMLAPAAANAATAHPAHTQTVSTASNFAEIGNGSCVWRTVRYRTVRRTVVRHWTSYGYRYRTVRRTVYGYRTVCR